jgi:fumarate reductase subunit D
MAVLLMPVINMGVSFSYLIAGQPLVILSFLLVVSLEALMLHDNFDWKISFRYSFIVNLISTVIIEYYIYLKMFRLDWQRKDLYRAVVKINFISYMGLAVLLFIAYLIRG